MTFLRAPSGCSELLRTFRNDHRGASAVEFAFILPLMLIIFFGTVEISNAVAADRKVTLTARALSDLLTQATTVVDGDFTNSFSASSAIMTPYPVSSASLQSKISEIKIDSSGNATIAWSKGYNVAGRGVGSAVTVPAALKVPSTYLIWSEVSYTYTPVVGYVVKTALTMTDQFYSRPRQSACVLYGTSSCP